ncbi:hypothetical protein NL676_034885 [Syzygium grande]|nr:hypothetical protein NL676_034885 [Syzygium grande]
MWKDWLVDDGTAASWDDGNGGAGNSGEELVLDSGERDFMEPKNEDNTLHEDDDVHDDMILKKSVSVLLNQ